MSISIYTYRDPYRLNEESYWPEICSCPYFCASQTLVNGLKSLYRGTFQQGRVTTIKNLTDSLFEGWNSSACLITQHADIDNVLSAGVDPSLAPDLQRNLSNAFLFNRDDVLLSIRTMVELGLDLPSISQAFLTAEQRFIVALYSKLLASKEKDFSLSTPLDKEAVDTAIYNAMLGVAKDESPLSSIADDRIVIHGIHQFTPLILRSIEEISKYRKVILLFNYQPQYKNVYQTWADIYNTFDCPVQSSSVNEFRPSMALPVSYESNTLADHLGKLVNGRLSDIAPDHNCEILEFDNMMEFAGYVADIFERAASIDHTQPMAHMTEQIYAANSAVNNVLKMYFPEQFGERQFLNYPLGHFFLAVANMWDPASNELQITDMNDIKECLQAGILKESYLGELSTIFGKISSLFEDCTTIDEMASRIKKVRRHQKHLSSEKQESVSHIAYYAISRDELDLLDRALQELNDLAAYFYEDFESQPHNFKKFYSRLKEYLQNDILEDRDLSEEFSDVIRRVLTRLDQVKGDPPSASFECLKATMSIYLLQETKPGKSANWIVRDFEQIDGDILRSKCNKVNGTPVVYHFACLADEDMNAVQVREFPWPLDAAFFEVAQDPIDWKCQVFVKSRKEYKNFKRYALVYGLEFNRSAYKLSYIKTNGEKELAPYYLLKVLGARKSKYEETKFGKFLEKPTYVGPIGTSSSPYTEFDYYRYKICKYRFLLESIVEGTTIYKGPFLLAKYLEVLLENQVSEELQGMPVSELVINDALCDAFDDLKKFFPFITSVHRLDVIRNIKQRILSRKQKSFPVLSPGDRRHMMIRELFIQRKLFDPKESKKDILAGVFGPVSSEMIEAQLSDEALVKIKYNKGTDLWCQYCSNRDLCTASYIESI